MILNASRLSTVLIAGHFGNKLYQIPLDNTYQTYSANTRAIAELQKASPTCSVYIGKVFNEWKESTCKSDAASPRYTLESSLDLDLDLV